MGNDLIETRAEVILNAARSIVIQNDDQFHQAANTLSAIKALAAEVKRDREDERVAAKATLDAIVASRNRHLQPLLEAEKIIKAKQIAWEDQQAARRREEQARLEAEAQAEAERLAEEQAILAAQLEEAGDSEQAKAVIEAPPEPPAPIILPDTKPKVTGQHTVTHWKCRLKDINLVDRSLLTFDQKAANIEVQRVKLTLSKRTGERATVDKSEIDAINDLPNGTALPDKYQTIPGVEIYLEKTRAASGR